MYGEKFSVGDIIRCCIDLSKDFTVSYFKNGKFLGCAYKIPNKYWDRYYYPAINVRNVAIEVNFGMLPVEYCPIVNESSLTINLLENLSTKTK